MKPNDISKREQLVDGLGTHYVSKISYGGQMVASVKLNFPPNSSGYVKFTLFYTELSSTLRLYLGNGHNTWSVDSQ